MSEELKPCPFCGNKKCGTGEVLNKYCEYERVSCGACGAEGPGAELKKEAYELWNTRANTTDKCGYL